MQHHWALPSSPLHSMKKRRLLCWQPFSVQPAKDIYFIFPTDPGVATINGHLCKKWLLRRGAGNCCICPSAGEETHRHPNNCGNYPQLAVNLSAHMVAATHLQCDTCWQEVAVHRALWRRFSLALVWCSANYWLSCAHPWLFLNVSKLLVSLRFSSLY